MAISNSNDRPAWIVELHLFSGRPDPRWQITAEQGREMVEIWRQLAPADSVEPFDKPPTLGYRGCSLCGPEDERWNVAAGVATRASGTLRERRDDREHRFERALLQSAPAALLEEPVGKELTSCLARMPE